jgi:SAM-dependent methyltransferase
MSDTNHAVDIEIVLSPNLIRQENDRCWIVNVTNVFGLGDEEQNLEGSRVQIFENGTPLGPAHAKHSRIRSYGRGTFSHWKGSLYFSSSDNTPPASNGRIYVLKGPQQAYTRYPAPQEQNEEPPLFPRLKKMRSRLEETSLTSILNSKEPAGSDELSRVRLLEAKIEYLLDEVYSLKSLLRWHQPSSEMLQALHRSQIESFNFQWKNLPYNDVFMSNPLWRERAVDDLCQRAGLPPEWFRGKKILDCGCGPGRHAWTFAKLRAQVTAFDSSETGVAKAREECRDFSTVTVEQRNILEPLPYDCDYDLVWSFGVLHCTGDTFGGLKNITRHVRPGGQLYFMVYAEPDRSTIGDYVYYHEVMAMRQALIAAPYEERARVLALLDGANKTQEWFDAISSQINDLYTVEELFRMVEHLGFENIRRTKPDVSNHNIVATKRMA